MQYNATSGFHIFILQSFQIVHFSLLMFHKLSLYFRAVFLTYNPKREGDFHDLYYEKMTKIRNEWKVNSGFQAYQDKMNDLKALDTIPKT